MSFSWRGLSRALLFVASLSMVGGWAGRAAAQDSPDPAMLDTKDAKPEGKPNSRGKKSAQQPSGTQAKTGKPGGDRQFGELEGWSPGKSPGADASGKNAGDQSAGSGSKAPVSMSPSGNMSVGLPF